MEGFIIIVLGLGMGVGYAWLISDLARAEVGQSENDNKERE